MPASKKIEEKYKELEDEILSVRQYSAGVEKENKELKLKLKKLTDRIKNLYHSLGDL